MASTISAWRCKCGLHFDVIAETDDNDLTQTQTFTCPECGDIEVIKAARIVSIDRKMDRSTLNFRLARGSWGGNFQRFKVGDCVTWARAVLDPNKRGKVGTICTVSVIVCGLDDFVLYEVQFEFGKYKLYGTQLELARPRSPAKHA